MKCGKCPAQCTLETALLVLFTVLSSTSARAAAAATNTVDWNDLHQRIDGFGASCAFSGRTWTAAQADMFFSTNSGTGVSFDGQTNFPFAGAGLSLLRNRVLPGGTASASELGLMQMAQARGAMVWSAPWSPATMFKNTNSVNGGSYVSNAANNQAYANQLAGYVTGLASSGVSLYALSVQNEPDVSAAYESCVWTAQEIHDFVPYLYNALAASNATATKIILPESEHWQSNTNLYVTAMNDSNVAAMVSIIADHNYDNTPPSGTPAALPAYGKTLWETETAILTPSGSNDPSITNGVYWAGRVHLFMTAAQANAWHYWWLVSLNSTGNQGLADTNGVAAKRLYTLGNFSRFVRPGYYRIGVSGSGAAQISAYKSSSGAFAIVAINGSSSDLSQTFSLTNFNVSESITPWITSSNLSLASQPVLNVTNSSFTAIIPSESVVTFTGRAVLAPALLSSLKVSPTQSSFTVSGPQGPNYSVLVSSNLASWSLLFETNSPATPFTVRDTNVPASRRRFYRVELGP